LCDKSAKKRKGVLLEAKRQVQDRAKKGVKMGCEGKHRMPAGRADDPCRFALSCDAKRSSRGRQRGHERRHKKRDTDFSPFLSGWLWEKSFRMPLDAEV
jgi:hypothetical protein